MSEETTAVRLGDRVDEIEERIDELEARAEDVDRDTDEGQAIEREYKELHGKLQSFQKYLQKWDSGEFVVREFTFGQMMRTKDKVAEESFQVKYDTSGEGSVEGSTKQGLYKTQVLKMGTKSTPVGAPAAEDLPYHVGEWLYDQIDNLNTFGDTDIGNLSPWGEES